MIIPGLMPVIVPIFLGFTLGAEAVAAFLIGVTLSGFILAMQMNTGEQHGTTPRSTSKRDTWAARALRPTRQQSPETHSATRSRIQLALHCTCW